MNKRISIHASFKDCIESIIHHNNKELPLYMKTKEIIKDDKTDKKEITDLLNNCINFYIEDDEIIFMVNRSAEEIKQYYVEQEQSLKYSILRLKKWYSNKQEDKTEIKEYLEFKKLVWIIKELDKNY